MVWVAFGGGGGGVGTSIVFGGLFFCGGLVLFATHPIKMKISSYAGAFCGLFLFWRRFSFLSFGRGAVIKAQQLSIYILWIS